MLKIITIAIIILIFLFPYYWMIIISLEPLQNVTDLIPHFTPHNMTFDNYKFLFFEVKEFYRWLFNSLYMPMIAVTLNCLIASLAGYVFAKKVFPGSKVLFYFMLATMAIPINSIILPRFILMKDLGLLNTYTSMYIVGIVGAGGMFLMKQIISTIPTELLESAKIDGANEWQIYWHIIVPIIKPGLIVLGIFTFVGTYNDYYWQLLMITSSSMKTLPLAVAGLVNSLELDGKPIIQLKMAAAFIASWPLLILFFVLHKYFLKGIRIGSVKG
ncbi:L-arabinose transport system permease protein AraQ [subsurface metagenome]